MKIKLVIAGDSHFNNYDLFKRKLDEYLDSILKHNNVISVLCLEQYKHMLDGYIIDKGYEHIIFTDYLQLPMIQYISDVITKSADCSIIFWDGVDSDAKMLIEKCEWYENKYRVVNYRHGKESNKEELTTA